MLIGGPLDRSTIEIDDLPSKTHFTVQIPEPPEFEDIEAFGVGFFRTAPYIDVPTRYETVRYNLFQVKSRAGNPHEVFAAEGTEWMLIHDRIEELDKK